jgi:hypothetical protein
MGRLIVIAWPQRQANLGESMTYNIPRPRPAPTSSQRASQVDRPGVRPHRAVGDGLSGWARRWLHRLESALAETAPDRMLSYREVVYHLATNRPDGLSPARGALLRRQRPGVCEFRLLYLDETDEPLTDQTGRTIGIVILARDCDEDLHEMFGHNDLIIFE